jgi:hypothetical protein
MGNVLARLLRLKEIADRPEHGSQACYSTCLWSEAIRDELLRSAGIGRHADYAFGGPGGVVPNENIHQFFGISASASADLFGAGSIERKREFLRALTSEPPAPKPAPKRNLSRIKRLLTIS